MIDPMMIVQDASPPDASGAMVVNLMAGTVVWFGGAVAVGALLLLVSALAPNITHRAGYCLRTRSALSFAIGLVAAGLLFLAAVVGHRVPPVAVGVLALSIVGSALAFEASSEALGRKVAILAGRDGSRVSHLLWGWFALILAGGIPYIGWFVVLPCGLVAGLGATILGFFVREEV